MLVALVRNQSSEKDNSSLFGCTHVYTVLYISTLAGRERIHRRRHFRHCHCFQILKQMEGEIDY